MRPSLIPHSPYATETYEGGTESLQAPGHFATPHTTYQSGTGHCFRPGLVGQDEDGALAQGEEAFEHHDLTHQGLATNRGCAVDQVTPLLNS